jgi:hypothetical protein
MKWKDCEYAEWRTKVPLTRPLNGDVGSVNFENLQKKAMLQMSLWEHRQYERYPSQICNSNYV